MKSFIDDLGALVALALFVATVYAWLIAAGV